MWAQHAEVAKTSNQELDDNQTEETELELERLRKPGKQDKTTETKPGKQDKTTETQLASDERIKPDKVGKQMEDTRRRNKRKLREHRGLKTDNERKLKVRTNRQRKSNR